MYTCHDVFLLLIGIQIIDLVAHKNPRASILQVGGVTPELVREALQILEADDSKARRFKTIGFLDRDEDLIKKMATLYEGLRPEVQFTHIESEKSNLLLEHKDSSIDLAILGSQGLPEQQYSEASSRIVRMLKPGGKLLVMGPVEHAGAGYVHLIL